MKHIIEFLIQRDGLTEKEARDLVIETRDMIYECNGNYDEAEEIMMEQLGLEMDYLLDIL